MVERMVSSNLSKYGLGKSESILSISKNQPVSVKDTTVIDLQNDKNGPPRPVDDFASQKEGQKEETVTQPLQAKSLPGNNNVSNNLVYARRKADGELNNSRALDKNLTPGNQQAGDKKPSPQLGNDGVQSIARIPANSVAARIGSENEHSSMPAMEHWNTRFSQLQGYLQRCNTLNQEVYLQKLRSYSPDECSRHAVELERRAIQLMVDEGKEIQRVKVLNVVGKSAGNHLLLSSVFKPENHV
ncbi:hypothetical protein CTI12_AA344040 [Artemisia annua]|uniref:Uncharacterized protein n=1 Tax=Artemisia annua TaxID=35608 RepID=A0A2U1M3B3_ARTAN|nr:hypothetical protein CTI12_AA344040 [Artemisia annua]